MSYYLCKDKLWCIILFTYLLFNDITGKRGGCSHGSDDDATDESDLEEGEIVDSDEESHANDTEADPKLTLEVQAKVDHPERVHELLCFNDKGEVSVSL